MISSGTLETMSASSSGKKRPTEETAAPGSEAAAAKKAKADTGKSSTGTVPVAGDDTEKAEEDRPKKRPCQFYPDCKNPNCPFVHPEAALLTRKCSKVCTYVSSLGACTRRWPCASDKWRMTRRDGPA